jgi:methylglutaconyl-CoA hydratase
MTDKPTENDLNALDITDAEAAEMNAIAHPLVPDPAPDGNDDLVQVDGTADGVVFITINRPAKKNAFDAATIAALFETFETLHGADNVRVVFIRGAGGTFSAGADLNWMRDAIDWSESDNRDDAMMLAKMLKALHDIPALTVALVEGAAMGGGAGIVCACDMAVAVEGSRFAFSEVKLGLIPATIGPRRDHRHGPARRVDGRVCLHADRQPDPECPRCHGRGQAAGPPRRGPVDRSRPYGRDGEADRPCACL